MAHERIQIRFDSFATGFVRFSPPFVFGVRFTHILPEEGLKISFSNIEYHSIAGLVGLDPLRNLNDIGTFDLYRSRIPAALFKSIVEDMDIMLIQYGPPPEQKAEWTRSRFLSPVRLISSFLCHLHTETHNNRSSIDWWLNLALGLKISQS